MVLGEALGTSLGGLDLAVTQFLRLNPLKTHRFFHEGWGDTSIVAGLRKHMESLILDTEAQVAADWVWEAPSAATTSSSNVMIQTGSFLSPLHEWLPEESKRCQVQIVYHSLPPASLSYHTHTLSSVV